MSLRAERRQVLVCKMLCIHNRAWPGVRPVSDDGCVCRRPAPCLIRGSQARRGAHCRRQGGRRDPVLLNAPRHGGAVTSVPQRDREPQRMAAVSLSLGLRSSVRGSKRFVDSIPVTTCPPNSGSAGQPAEGEVETRMRDAAYSAVGGERASGNANSTYLIE